MNEKDVPEVLDKITDVVLKYRPKEKRKKKRKRKKYDRTKPKKTGETGVKYITPMEYYIVNGDYYEVMREVNKLLGEGWDLAGGIAITSFPDSNEGFYAQAMTRVTAEHAERLNRRR